tara:strand:- start:368 stop:583 length:216 start_codon:yes stop_codon:yes gene_type:complete
MFVERELPALNLNLKNLTTELKRYNDTHDKEKAEVDEAPEFLRTHEERDRSDWTGEEIDAESVREESHRDR